LQGEPPTPADVDRPAGHGVGRRHLHGVVADDQHDHVDQGDGDRLQAGERRLKGAGRFEHPVEQQGLGHSDGRGEKGDGDRHRGVDGAEVPAGVAHRLVDQEEEGLGPGPRCGEVGH
jgi:hypothetical protein